MMPKDPYAYVEVVLQASPSPDYDDVLPVEGQPLPVAVLPIADSAGYIPKSDLEEDPKEDDEDLKEDLADYPIDREDDDEEEEEEESSRDNVEDEDEEEDKDEEEEHPALADSIPPSPDTNEVYGRLDDAQDDRLFMSGQVNLLRRDRRAHAHTTRLMESEAILSHKAWV
nr:hypothetical protein [Tanacetum cinerariifolium]